MYKLDHLEHGNWTEHTCPAMFCLSEPKHDTQRLIMKIRFLIASAFFLVLQTPASADPLDNLKTGQPRDVVELIDRLVGCNHWSGEEGYDAERRKEIAEAMADLKCDRLERDEAAALKRYAKKPGTIKALRRAKETSD